jgi:nucleotide-binding universal stress UspA family protein
MKRILVAVDTSPRSLAPLEMAVDLAARMQAQLETLFVEDMNLLHLAELPFATELDRTSGEVRALNAPSLSYALETQTRRLRQLLHTFGEQKKIQTHLRVVRGNYVTEAMRAEADVSFLFTSKRVSVMTSAKTSKPGGVRPFFRSTAPVYVYYAGGAESARPLLLASDLAGILGTELVILLPSRNKKTIATLKKQSLKLLGDQRPARFESMDSDFAHFTRHISSGGCTLLVMPKQDAQSQLAEIQTLEAIHCPLVLVA